MATLLSFIGDIIDSLPYLISKYRHLPALLLLPGAAVFVPIIARQASQAARAVAIVLASVIILAMVWASILYQMAPGYLDHVEPSIAAVSWWYSHGHPLYPALDDGDGVYGLVYGPLLFQVTAAALALGPSILLSKLPGFLGFWLACGALAWALRPLLPSARQSLLPVAVMVLVAGGYWRAAYWVRAEPFLILFAALASCSYIRFGRTAAAVSLGLLSGCAVNMKLHGALYILPYAVGLLAYPASTASRVRIAAIGIGCGLFAAALPFLDPNVSLVHYVAALRATLNHGLDRSLLIADLWFGAVLIMPFLIVAWQRVRGEVHPDRPMGLAYCACVLVVCLIGGKKGAGPTHLLPFLPLFLFFVARAAQSARVPDNLAARSAVLPIYFLALVVAYAPSFVSNLLSLQAWDRIVDNPAFREEATQLYAAYPTAGMGAAGGQSYALTEYAVIGVFAGGPLVFDTTSWMDLQKDGVPEEVIQRLLVGCRTPFWIIPKGGEPFTQTAAYDSDPLFSDRFRELFRQNYEPVRKGAFYDVWRCRDDRP
ncbi:MAG: hypothetical protein QOH05_328 [Acetobacteraceae bacterium]|nr:hypothetical protein [Acetobacteraceae bacterium]